MTVLPVAFVAVVARGGIIEHTSVHTREQEATAALKRVVAGDFDPETDDARVFKVGPVASENIYSYRPEEG